MLTIDDHIKFFKRELEQLEINAKEIFYSTALSLHERGELYVGLYAGFDPKRGNIFVDLKFNRPENLPRIEGEYYCIKLPQKLKAIGDWGNITYADLLGSISTNELSDCKLITFMEAKYPNSIKGLFNDISPEFLQNLELNTVLIIGPKEPPYDYYINLIEYSNRIKNNSAKQAFNILNFTKEHSCDRFPTLLAEDINQYLSIIDSLKNNNITILQGPPGTGKTYLIAQLITHLVNENKSVILTALTNKACIEVCNKGFFKEFFKNGKVWKTSIKTQEKVKYPDLLPISEIKAMPGNLVLTTYYKISDSWQVFSEPCFDYIIVEEASQAFLTTIVAGLNIAKKIIVVGDPYQIEPIVIQNRPETISKEISKLIYGLKSISAFLDFPFLRKICSYRLTKRAVTFTNHFYQNTLFSKNENPLTEVKQLLGSCSKYLNPQGGPTLIKLNLSNSKTPIELIDFMKYSLSQIDIDKLDVAILTPFTKTTKFLQSNLISLVKGKKIVIDNIDRIQGLDVDACFFIIPNDNYTFSLNYNRFNVASSRSKYCTFIVGDINLPTNSIGPKEVIEYLKKLDTEFSFIANEKEL